MVSLFLTCAFLSVNKRTEKFSPFSLLQTHLSLQLSREEGASALSSSFSPFCHLPLHHPSLHVSFEASLFVFFETLFTSLEVLSVFLEALCHGFHVLLFNNGIDHPLTVNLPFNGRISGSLCFLPKIFGFDFFKIKFAHFGKTSPPTHPSIVFLVSAAIVCHSTSMRRSVSYTRLRVDLTRQHVLHVHAPPSMELHLYCCLSASSTSVSSVLSSFDAIVQLVLGFVF